MEGEINFKKKLRAETVAVRTISLLAAALTVALLAGMILYILAVGLPAVNWSFLSAAPSFLEQTYGILPMIVNTVMLVALGLLITLPLGIGGALYLSEYARQGRFWRWLDERAADFPRLSKIVGRIPHISAVGAIRFTIEILSGIPSIVFGLFGALFFVAYFGMGYSILSGACTLAILTLPVVIRTTEESLKAVDASYREAALSMGVSRLHIIRTILLPCSVPGIITAVVLCIGRMVGESAALLCTSGTSYDMPGSFFGHIMESGSSLSVQLYQGFTERIPGMENPQKFGIAAVLMVIVFCLNFITGLIGSKFRKGNAK